jgi:hypothetical protein
MTALTASEARANLYRLIDQVAESHKPIFIAGKRRSAVLLEGDPGNDVCAVGSWHAQVDPRRDGRAIDFAR